MKPGELCINEVQSAADCDLCILVRNSCNARECFALGCYAGLTGSRVTLCEGCEEEIIESLRKSGWTE